MGMSNEHLAGGKPQPDVQETASKVYASVTREHEEPVSGVELIPWWYFIVASLVLMAGSLYLGAFNGGFQMKNLFAVANYVPASRPLAEGEVAVVQTRPWIDVWMEDGKSTYNLCAACHQPTGLGMPGMFPPLAGSEWVQGGSERVAAIIMAGIQGPLTVKGTAFGLVPMPAQGAVLTDKQIAQVMTYIRRSWGNQASVVTEEMVADARKKYGARTQPWTEAELKALPDADLPGKVPDLATGK